MAGVSIRGAIYAATVAAAMLVPASASASEHVLDGSFDAVTACNPGDCTSPVWAEGGSGGGTGPLCQVGTGSCGYFQGPTVTPFSPPNWVQLGGETIMGDASYAVQQVVNVPAGPTTLSFQLQIKDSNVSTGAFTAKIDGTPVYAAGGGTPGHAAYAPVTVDISAFSGGLRTLKFENLNATTSGSSDSFNVDNVSIVDSPPPTTPTQAAATTPTAKKCPKGKKLKKGRCVRKKRKKHH
jgi:hypothetical protein